MTRTTAVVGGGVIGAAVAWHLARRGHHVVVFDQRRGGVAATAQSGGLLRLHHTADCDIALAARALPTFQRFGELVGGDCGYRPTGFALLVGAEHGEALRHNVDKVRAAGGKAEVVEPGALAARYPGLRLDGVAAAAYEPDGGYADPAATARLLLDGARARGARPARGTSTTAEDGPVGGGRGGAAGGRRGSGPRAGRGHGSGSEQPVDEGVGDLGVRVQADPQDG